MHRRIVRWIREQVESASKRGGVVGLSGGIDSSVVAVLAREALGDNVLCLIMPCHSKPEDAEHALMVSKKWNIPTETIDLTGIYDNLLNLFPPGDRMVQANLQPRLRMAALYHYASVREALVLGTSNRSELTVGYFTKWGDGAADLLPLGGLLKTQVMELAREIGLPPEILEKPPSAGLWKGQTDEGEMGISYDDLDAILLALDTGDTERLDPEKVSLVLRMMDLTRHKREFPPRFIP
jgi:NAD+ synthase